MTKSYDIDHAVDEAVSDQLVFSYLAGAIDSDGFITVTQSLRTKGKRYTHAPTYYHPRIGFTSTDLTVPILFKETFGGGLSTHRPKNTKHKHVHIWAVGTADAGRVAKALLPHLRMKIRQAELIIDLCKIIEVQHQQQKATQKPPYRITPEQLSIREMMWKDVTKLNNPRNRRVHHVGKEYADPMHRDVSKNELPVICS